MRDLDSAGGSETEAPVGNRRGLGPEWRVDSSVGKRHSPNHSRPTPAFATLASLFYADLSFYIPLLNLVEQKGKLNGVFFFPT